MSLRDEFLGLADRFVRILENPPEAPEDIYATAEAAEAASGVLLQCLVAAKAIDVPEAIASLLDWSTAAAVPMRAERTRRLLFQQASAWRMFVDWLSRHSDPVPDPFGVHMSWFRSPATVDADGQVKEGPRNIGLSSDERRSRLEAYVTVARAIAEKVANRASAAHRDGAGATENTHLGDTLKKGWENGPMMEFAQFVGMTEQQFRRWRKANGDAWEHIKGSRRIRCYRPALDRLRKSAP